MAAVIFSIRTLAALGICAFAFACSDPVRHERPPDEDGGPGPGDPPVFPMHQQHPAWSRQGLVAYLDLGIICVDSSGTWWEDPSIHGLWTFNPATGERRRILEWGRAPSWSPDGTMLAFGEGKQIFTLHLATQAVTRLTSEGWNFWPSWSPDGQWIAYEWDGVDGGGSGRIKLIHADGSGDHSIGPDGCTKPSWSPDGQRILHIRALADGTGLFSMDVAGENALEIRRRPEDQVWQFPQYSSDGSQIAVDIQFVRGSVDGLPEIWAMSADGTMLRQLTTQGGSHPSWSPDDNDLVFTREDFLRNTPENGVLWTCNVQTGGQHQILAKWPEQCSTPVTREHWGDVKRRFR